MISGVLTLQFITDMSEFDLDFQLSHFLVQSRHDFTGLYPIDIGTDNAKVTLKKGKGFNLPRSVELYIEDTTYTVIFGPMFKGYIPGKVV